MEENGLPDFSGKLVMFYLSSNVDIANNTVVVEYMRFERAGDRLFVMGRVPVVEGLEWVGNCQAAIAWDSVTYYVEFKSVEDFKRRMDQFKPSLIERLREFIR